MTKTLYESGENYLETILLLEQQQGAVRVTDVAKMLDYSKASVSRAMNILQENGFIEKEKGSAFVLTKLGKERARKIYERHTTIAKFLVLTLDLDQETAERDACRIEHIISPSTFRKMKEKVKSFNLSLDK